MGIPVDDGMDLNAAARAALLEMIDHLERTTASSAPPPTRSCSVAVDLRISEVVDVPYPVVSALLRLDVFESGEVHPLSLLHQCGCSAEPFDVRSLEEQTALT